MTLMHLFILVESALCLALIYNLIALALSAINPHNLPWGDYRPWSNLQPDQQVLSALADLLNQQYIARHKLAKSHQLANNAPWISYEKSGLSFLSDAWLRVTLAMEGSRDFRLSTCRTWNDLRRDLIELASEHVPERPATQMLLALGRVLEDDRRSRRKSCRVTMNSFYQQYRSAVSGR